MPCLLTQLSMSTTAHAGHRPCPVFSGHTQHHSARSQEGMLPTSLEARLVFPKLLPRFLHQQIWLCYFCLDFIISKLINLTWKNPRQYPQGLCMYLILMSMDLNILNNPYLFSFSPHEQNRNHSSLLGGQRDYPKSRKMGHILSITSRDYFLFFTKEKVKWHKARPAHKSFKLLALS